jgi:hypothetical protein
MSGRAWARSARGEFVVSERIEDVTSDKLCPVGTSDIVEEQVTSDNSCREVTSDIVEQQVTSDSCDGELAAAGMCGSRVVSKPLSEYQIKLQMCREQYMDPASKVAHLMSQCDLKRGCRAFLSCLFEY